MVIHLAIQALSLGCLQACHWDKGNKWTRDCRETNPASDGVEALNGGPLDYNTSSLNHSATLPPLVSFCYNLYSSSFTKTSCRVLKNACSNVFERTNLISCLFFVNIAKWSEIFSKDEKEKGIKQFTFIFTSVFQLCIYNLSAVVFIDIDYIYFRNTSNEVAKKKRLKSNPWRNQSLLQQKVQVEV